MGGPYWRTKLKYKPMIHYSDIQLIKFESSRNSSGAMALLVREIDCFQRISQASPGLANRRAALQVLALKGYVEYPGNGVILGLLQEWIPSEYKLRDLEKTISQDLDALQELRGKRAGKIRETIQTLHTLGGIWGDAKPSNIIIDLNDDAWIIDFGGDWTDGGVDEDLQETIESDKQGVARILKLLDVDA
ncbi:Protein kinase 3 [Diaporthe amygdali]|uniref:Protein kinase 3 n=1 Tax=Phomopsis amygdali TaxID=1214568 RepID=UPI0022FDF5B8|nr:Protein kinase 3 [Diaporthe amygdali]KAJ0115785.1 Protein kinase 3 [Diaporthe amygdali]